MYKLSVQSQEVLQKIEAQTEQLSPRKTKVYAVNIFNEDAYGVYVLSPAGTIGYGHGVKSIYGYGTYVEVDYYHNRTDKTVMGSTHSQLIHVPDEEFVETIKEMAREEIDNHRFDLCLIMDAEGNVIVVN